MPSLNLEPILGLIGNQAALSTNAAFQAIREPAGILERAGQAINQRQLEAAMAAAQIKAAQQREQSRMAREIVESTRQAMLQSIQQQFQKRQLEREIAGRKAVAQIRAGDVNQIPDAESAAITEGHRELRDITAKIREAEYQGQMAKSDAERERFEQDAKFWRQQYRTTRESYEARIDTPAGKQLWSKTIPLPPGVIKEIPGEVAVPKPAPTAGTAAPMPVPTTAPANPFAAFKSVGDIVPTPGKPTAGTGPVDVFAEHFNVSRIPAGLSQFMAPQLSSAPSDIDALRRAYEQQQLRQLMQTNPLLGLPGY